MLHKLKPVPRGLVILAIIGVIGFTLSQVDFAKLMPKKAAPAEATVAVEAPAVTTVAPPTAVTAPPPNQATPPVAQSAPADAPTGLTPATNNAGLDAVLRAKK